MNGTWTLNKPIFPYRTGTFPISRRHVVKDHEPAQIIDSEGRHVIISPKQLAIVGSRLVDLADWLQHGDKDWVEPS